MSERVVKGRVRTKDVKSDGEGGYSWPHPVVVHPPNGRGGSVPVTVLVDNGPFERWMWVYLLTGERPEWAHDGIDGQDLKDLIAAAIQEVFDE